MLYRVTLEGKRTDTINFHIHLVRLELLNPTTFRQSEFAPITSPFWPALAWPPPLSAMPSVLEHYALAYTLSSALP